MKRRNRTQVEELKSVDKRCLTVNRIEVEQTLENVDTRNWSLFGRTALIPDLSQHGVSSFETKLVAQKNSDEKKINNLIKCSFEFLSWIGFASNEIETIFHFSNNQSVRTKYHF